jgi:SPP1 family holin
MKFKISKGTIVRTVMVAIVIINIILKKLGIGIINTDENTVASAVEMVIEVGAIICAWWYNNSFSTAAKKADRFFQAVKDFEKAEKTK